MTEYTKIRVVLDDITTLQIQAIVNAANAQLLPGGAGTNAAIHRAAGPRLAQACKKLAPCPTGEAVLTEGYDLPAAYVLHTVGPVWNGGNAREDEFLAASYRSCLRVAKQHGITEIAFPAISTGVFGFPIDRAAQITLKTLQDETQDDPHWKQIILCLFDVNNMRAFRQLLHIPPPTEATVNLPDQPHGQPG